MLLFLKASKINRKKLQLTSPLPLEEFAFMFFFSRWVIFVVANIWLERLWKCIITQCSSRMMVSAHVQDITFNHRQRFQIKIDWCCWCDSQSRSIMVKLIRHWWHCAACVVSYRVTQCYRPYIWTLQKYGVITIKSQANNMRENCRIIQLKYQNWTVQLKESFKLWLPPGVSDCYIPPSF